MSICVYCFDGLRERNWNCFTSVDVRCFRNLLNAREEQACIEAMQDHQDKEAKEKLIAHNLRLVVYIAKKFDNTRWEPKT